MASESSDAARTPSASGSPTANRGAKPRGAAPFREPEPERGHPAGLRALPALVCRGDGPSPATAAAPLASPPRSSDAHDAAAMEECDANGRRPTAPSRREPTSSNAERQPPGHPADRARQDTPRPTTLADVATCFASGELLRRLRRLARTHVDRRSEACATPSSGPSDWLGGRPAYWRSNDSWRHRRFSDWRVRRDTPTGASTIVRSAVSTVRSAVVAPLGKTKCTNNLAGYRRCPAKHWPAYGLNDGRRSSQEFDVRFYLNSHSDLLAAFRSGNYGAAFEHWTARGKGTQGPAVEKGGTKVWPSRDQLVILQAANTDSLQSPSSFNTLPAPNNNEVKQHRNGGTPCKSQ